MFKLITEQEEEKLLREYSLRRYVVIVLALSLVLGIGVVGFLPSYLLSNSRQNEATERAHVDSLLAGSDEGDPLEWINHINTQLNLLSPESDQAQPSEFIEALVNARIAGISIVSMSWGTNTKGAPQGKTLSISGIAQDRQTLINFEERINALNLFSNVSLPLSNLKKDRDIDFTLNLTVI